MISKNINYKKPVQEFLSLIIYQFCITNIAIKTTKCIHDISYMYCSLQKELCILAMKIYQVEIIVNCKHNFLDLFLGVN